MLFLTEMHGIIVFVRHVDILVLSFWFYLLWLHNYLEVW